MIIVKQITAVALLLMLSAVSLCAQERERRNQQEEAAYRLEIAEGLYQSGDYQGCLRTLDDYISDHNNKTFVFPNSQMARVCRLRGDIAGRAAR